MKSTKLLSVIAAIFLLLFSGQALAKEVVVNAVAPISDNYALLIVWSNLQAKTSSDNSITVVDNGTVKGLRFLAQKRINVSVLGAPHYLAQSQKS